MGKLESAPRMPSLKIALAVGLLGVGIASAAEPALRRFEFTRIEMAVPVRIVLYSDRAETATRSADAAFARIHALNAIMSDYDPESELRRLGDTAGEGKAVRVSDDLWKVLVHAQALAARSEGAFDVTVGPVVRLWRRARRQKELPSAEKLAAAQALVGYRLLRLRGADQTAELLKPGMRLDLGGIAKGYAMDEALAVLGRLGVHQAMVAAGGDVRFGTPPPGKPGWRIGITPLDDPTGPPIRCLEVADVAVSTSGDMVQFVAIGAKRYSHVVDPRTGIGLTDHCRVMVVAADGMTADALTKAVAVLGPEKGLRLIEDTPGTAAMISRAPKGKIEDYRSSRWQDLPVTPEKP
jgi:thiamine biosynthesis lipoprotein